MPAIPDAEALRHDLCGTPLATRWYCPTCDRTFPDDTPEADLRYLKGSKSLR